MDGAHLGAHHQGKGHVVGISGLGDDDLVARVESGHEAKEQGLGAARGDDDVVGHQIDVVLGVVAHELVAIALNALAGRIGQHFGIDLLQSVETTLRRMHVGLADVQVINFRAARLGCIGQGCELADRRFGHNKATC